MIDWLFLNRDYYMVLTTIIMVVYTIIVCTVVRNWIMVLEETDY